MKKKLHVSWNVSESLFFKEICNHLSSFISGKSSFFHDHDVGVFPPYNLISLCNNNG